METTNPSEVESAASAAQPNELLDGPPPIAAEPLARAVSATAGVSAWRIEVVREVWSQLYLIGRLTEANRRVATQRARITLANDHPAQTGKGASAQSGTDASLARGESTVTLPAEEVGDEAALAARLEAGVAMARLTDNPPYPLPGPPAQGLPDVRTADPALLGDLAPLALHLRERLEAAVAREGDIRLASAEIYLGHRALEQHNSSGFAGAYTSTLADLDLVLIASDGVEEVEFHADPHRRRLEDVVLEQMIPVYAAFARDSLRARLPQTYTGPVVLSGEALVNFFNTVVLHASARAVYQRLSRFRPGEPITPEAPRGTKLTLLSDALRPFGNQSAPFSVDGLPAQRVTLVQDGVFARPWADARYAAYLGVEPTGEVANLTVERGVTPLADLRVPDGGAVYEIVAFSNLLPDALTGNFASEIKLGYRHTPAGTTPIKGGSVSGNVFAALADAAFSTEAYSDGTYFGPAAIRFGSLTIAGA